MPYGLELSAVEESRTLALHGQQKGPGGERRRQAGQGEPRGGRPEDGFVLDPQGAALVQVVAVKRAATAVCILAALASAAACNGSDVQPSATTTTALTTTTLSDLENTAVLRFWASTLNRVAAEVRLWVMLGDRAKCSTAKSEVGEASRIERAADERVRQLGSSLLFQLSIAIDFCEGGQDADFVVGQLKDFERDYNLLLIRLEELPGA